MNLVIDKRKTNIIYVDKDNNHIANNNDIIKLIATNNTSAIDAYVKILAGTYNLNDTEIAVLKYLIAGNSNELAGIVCDAVAKLICKSIATVTRAIASLRDKRLIYIDSANAVKVSSSIATSTSAIVNAKFLIVELHPEITSNGITI